MVRDLRRIVRRLGGDDAGQDLLEWVVLTAFVAIAGILLLGIISGKMGAAYSQSTGSPGTGVQQIWEPCGGTLPPC